ncbi:MAG: flagellar assembly protein FliH [Gammaproteobacteria bacterium]|nr:flagellar assembly protein FliH [Gammaproteobacteria bacterium]
MKSTSSLSTKVLSADEAGKVETWEAPAMDAAGGPVTVQQIERIQKQAYDEGFARGRSDGLAASQGDIQQFRQVLQAMSDPLRDLDQALEQELILLAKAIARQLLRRELKEEPAHVVGVVREAIAALPAAARNVAVHLNPEDGKLVRDVLGAEEGERPWRIVDDPVINRGDCNIITENSRIDATLERRLTAVLTASLGDEGE